MNQNSIQSSAMIQHLKTAYPGNYQLKKHGKSFYFAQRLLPKKNQTAIHALYHLCRLIDDLGDNPNHTKTNALKQLQNIEKIIESHTQNNKIIIADNRTISTHELLTLVQGVRNDLNHQQYDSMEALITYCYQVAGTVGLMMCDLMNIHQPQARVQAIDLGIAMQLTNIARDVWTDAHIGRVYLPKTIIGQQSSEDILNAKPGQPQIKEGIRKILEMAEHFYHSGKTGLKAIPKPYRLCIFTAACLYQNIGKAIEKNNYFCPNKRSYVNLWQKIHITTQCIYRYNRNTMASTTTRFDESDLFRHLPCFTSLMEQT